MEDMNVIAEKKLFFFVAWMVHLMVFQGLQYQVNPLWESQYKINALNFSRSLLYLNSTSIQGVALKFNAIPMHRATSQNYIKLGPFLHSYSKHELLQNFMPHRLLEVLLQHSNISKFSINTHFVNFDYIYKKNINFN